MNTETLLGRIIATFSQNGTCESIEGKVYKFAMPDTGITKTVRPSGTSEDVPYKRLVKGIELYKRNPNLDDVGTQPLRDEGIKGITSLVHALLHLLPKSDYQS